MGADSASYRAPLLSAAACRERRLRLPTMYLKSLYPTLPPIPDENVHYCMFKNADGEEIKDYTLHIDAVTGRKRSYYEFRDRVYDGATALDALGLSAEAGNIVGIYSFNCMVSC